jgi:transcriptional regulator with XRE-family HTH domain
MTIHALPAPEQPTSLTLCVAEEVGVLAARHKRDGVNQAALARVLGISQSQVSKRMRGATPFTLAELGQLAWFFGVDPAVLLGAARNPHPAVPDGGLEKVRREGIEPPTR